MKQPHNGTFYLLLLLLIGTLAGSILIQYHHPHTPVKEQVKFDFNEGFPSFSTDTIRSFSFGFERAFSALLWLRFLQYTPPNSMGANDVSWIYLDLDAISEIDPDFIPVFTHGALFLSVITEDKKGAELLLTKGIQRYPDFWRFRAYLAYHYQYELGQPEKAAEHYKAAAILPGAPELMGLLAATLLSKQKDHQSAIEFLQNLIDSTSDEKMKNKFARKIEKIESMQNE